MSSQITMGSFKNVASTPYFIPLSQEIDSFELFNLTAMDVTAQGVSGITTVPRIVKAYFNRYLTPGSAVIEETIAAYAASQAGVAALGIGYLPQNGFTLFNAASRTLGANISGASFVPGQPTVFTAAGHGFQVGDIVRIINLASAPELGGLAMTVTAVTTNTFTTLLDSTNSLTSTFTVYKIGSSYLPPLSLYYPQVRAIAKISKANPMVVTTLVQQNYQVGDVVRFQIPTVFGMQQLVSGPNGLPVQFTVIAVNNAVGTQTVTLAVDSSAFTTFAWPLAASYPFSLPEMIPQGEGNINNFQSFGVVPAPLPYGNQNILGFATQNLGQNGILIGAGTGDNTASTGGIIGSTEDLWWWRAMSSIQNFPQVG